MSNDFSAFVDIRFFSFILLTWWILLDFLKYWTQFCMPRIDTTWKWYVILFYLGLKMTAGGNFSQKIKRCLLLGRKAMINLDSVLKSRDITLPTKVHIVKAIYGFSSSSVQIWVLDHKEGWPLKNWCLWTVVLEKTLERPLDSKEIKPVNPKGDQPWILIGRTDAEAPILSPPDAKSQLIRKDTDAGKDWRQEETGTTDQTVRWHHWLNGHEFEKALGDGKGHGSLTHCSPWGHKELDMMP